MASRDIKLENTLLDGSPRPLLKICDFGYSKARRALLPLPPTTLPGVAMLVCSPPCKCLTQGLCFCAQHEKFQSAPGSRVGTPAYLAPEVIMTTKGQTYDGKVRICVLTQQLWWSVRLC